MVCAPAWAQQELAQKKNCMACHAVNQKVIGPSYKEVATKYTGQTDAVAKLLVRK
jgi:cytochrome c